MFKLYPVFYCQNTNDEACACFQAYLYAQRYSLDLSYLRYLFKCHNHHAYLTDVLAGLDYLGVIYELQDTKTIFEENISGAIIKSGKHYYLTCGKIGKQQLLVSSTNGYQVIDESFVSNICIVIRFLGDFPYFKASRISLIPPLTQLLIFFLSTLLFQIIPVVFIPMLILLWTEIHLLKKRFINKKEHYIESGISILALQEWIEAMKIESHKDIILSLFVMSIAYVLCRYPLFVFFDLIMMGLLFAFMYFSFKEPIFYKRYCVFYTIIIILGCGWSGLIGLRIMMTHYLSSGFCKGTILFFVQIWYVTCLAHEKKHQSSLDHFILFSHEQIMPSEKKLESIGTIDVTLDASCLLMGKEDALDHFYQQLYSCELRVNQEAVTQLNGLTFIKNIYFYQDLMYLDKDKKLSEIFENQIDFLLSYLEELNRLALFRKMSESISQLTASEKELMGFLKLLCVDEEVFIFVRYAFYFQSESMVKGCLGLLQAKSTKAKVIVSLATIKLMNPNDLCAIIKTEKVGGYDGNRI